MYLTRFLDTVYCDGMNGERVQWLIEDNGVFSITCKMTTDEISHLRGENWYRPLVRYEQRHEAEGEIPIYSTEVHDTGKWLEAKRQIEEMRKRDGVELPVSEAIVS